MLIEMFDIRIWYVIFYMKCIPFHFFVWFDLRNYLNSSFRSFIYILLYDALSFQKILFSSTFCICIQNIHKKSEYCAKVEITIVYTMSTKYRKENNKSNKQNLKWVKIILNIENFNIAVVVIIFCAYLKFLKCFKRSITMMFLSFSLFFVVV